jgi:hypothetical protein
MSIKPGKIFEVDVSADPDGVIICVYRDQGLKLDNDTRRDSKNVYRSKIQDPSSARRFIDRAAKMQKLIYKEQA